MKDEGARHLGRTVSELPTLTRLPGGRAGVRSRATKSHVVSKQKEVRGRAFKEKARRDTLSKKQAARATKGGEGGEERRRRAKGEGKRPFGAASVPFLPFPHSVFFFMVPSFLPHGALSPSSMVSSSLPHGAVLVQIVLRKPRRSLCLLG